MLMRRGIKSFSGVVYAVEVLVGTDPQCWRVCMHDAHVKEEIPAEDDRPDAVS